VESGDGTEQNECALNVMCFFIYHVPVQTSMVQKMFSASLLNKLTVLLLFLLPWQTVVILQERFVDGVKWEYGTLSLYLTEGLLWLVILVFMGWYWRQFREQKKQGNWHLISDRQFLFVLLLFLLYAYLSAIWAVESSLALQQARRFLQAVLFGFILFLGPLSVQSVLRSIVAGSVLPSILGLVQFFTQQVNETSWLGIASHVAGEPGASIVAGASIGRWLRAYGTFSHPNVFGGYLVMSILAAFLLALSHKKKMETFTLSHVAFDHLFPVVVVVINSAVLVLTFSRSAWLALALILAVCTTYAVKRSGWLFRRLILYSILSLVVMGWLVFPLVNTRIERESLPEQRSTSERIDLIQQSVQLFASRSLLGVGGGNYTAAAMRSTPNFPVWEYQPVHVVPLMLVTELGLFGVILMFGVIIAAGRLFLLTRPNKNNHGSWFFPVGLSLSLLPLFLLDHYLYSSWIGLLIMVIFCFIIAKFYHHTS